MRFIGHGWKSLPQYLVQPFTVGLWLLIIAASFLAHDGYGRIDIELAEQVGHAPRHWWAGELLRLFTSIPFTSNRAHLASALLMTLLCVGSYEYRRGTLRTAGLFLAVHCSTLAILAASFAFAHWASGSEVSRRLLDTSDVGPSAGYYGCLGACLFESKHGWLVGLGMAVAAWLSMRALLTGYSTDFHPHVFQADLAHLLAILLGGLVGWFHLGSGYANGERVQHSTKGLASM